MEFSAMLEVEPVIHNPVMPEEVILFLITNKKGLYVDATTGTGGHSKRILEALDSQGRLLSIDRDPLALSVAGSRCKDDRQILLKGRFSELGEIIHRNYQGEVDGVLFDLGVSMFQLKSPKRGFSFTSPERLDMRMDTEQGLDAYEVVNSYTEQALEELIRNYGEEPKSKRIARAIVERRKRKAIEYCSELSDLISSITGFHGRTHPATRTFQALRMEVNGEIKELRAGLEGALRGLKRGGRLCVISYHSLEDREVKKLFRESERASIVKIMTKKPIRPSEEEIRHNRASRSAKMRICERL